MPKLPISLSEIAFCVVGCLIVWTLIDAFGGPELDPLFDAGYSADQIETEAK